MNSVTTYESRYGNCFEPRTVQEALDLMKPACYASGSESHPLGDREDEIDLLAHDKKRRSQEGRRNAMNKAALPGMVKADKAPPANSPPFKQTGLMNFDQFRKAYENAVREQPDNTTDRQLWMRYQDYLLKGGRFTGQTGMHDPSVASDTDDEAKRVSGRPQPYEAQAPSSAQRRMPSTDNPNRVDGTKGPKTKRGNVSNTFTFLGQEEGRATPFRSN
jgi:hypothetical protein